jgi:hypothetical protein
MMKLITPDGRLVPMCATCHHFESVMGRCICGHPDHHNYIEPSDLCSDYFTEFGSGQTIQIVNSHTTSKGD